MGMVFVGICLVMIFVLGVKVSYFVGFGLFGVVGFVGFVLLVFYWIKCIILFLNFWEDLFGSGF